MFYSEDLLGKTGALARVWLSANMERKVSKNQVLATSIKQSVETIVAPNQAPFALRMSAQLLVGVARIYSRQTRYLLDDCNEALLKIKMVCCSQTLSQQTSLTRSSGLSHFGKQRYTRGTPHALPRCTDASRRSHRR
jgi:hypothetical protein